MTMLDYETLIAQTARYAFKFTDLDGTQEFWFPPLSYEYAPTQELGAPTATLIGEDFGYDLLGDGEAPLDFGRDPVRFVLYEENPAALDAQIQDLKRNVVGNGNGWLYTTDATGLIIRRARARALRMPEYVVDRGTHRIVGVSLEFRRDTLWYSDSEIVYEDTSITASPENVSITNDGDRPARDLVIEVRSLSAAGFSNFKLTNPVNGHVFETTYDAASNQTRLRLRTRIPILEVSTDAGVNWVYAFEYYVAPPSVAQKHLSFHLARGAQTLVATSSGTPNYHLIITAEEPWL